MAEKDNPSHQSILEACGACSAGPSTSTPDYSLLTAQWKTRRGNIKLNSFIEEATTGKRIYLKDAIFAVGRYMDSLDSLSDTGADAMDERPVLYELVERENSAALSKSYGTLHFHRLL